MVQVVDPRAQNLRIWIERKYVQAYDIASNAGAPETYRFLPRGAAEKHLRDNNNLWTRLLLKETFGDQNGPDAKSVAQNYCRILCILTTLSKQRFIASFVNYTSLSDARLPFETRPSNFPDDPDDTHFYTKFFERQWHFCSRVLEKHTSSLIPKHEVLPILNLDRRGTGGSATVYRATVHEDHDQLRQSSSDDESPSTDPAHCYAIKTFRHSRRDSEPSYEQEKTAFQLLTQTRDGASPGLIAFYGGFEYGDTFNILLEYADGGTLNEYMRDHDQPQTYQEAVDLWSHVFDTIKGLCCIHNMYLHDSGANHQRFMRQG
ncbi:kinase-like protein [Teratosphaeria destructans]|uniref:Kinase-like protein n=1 Tax=Teratosphaeria destructans TaxID=418781 RepID=A0A9W7W4M9_9PEZI|nr:kinase-like protein [Teratosphaeria destructans]